MAKSFRRRVAFSETDASGRAHFTALLKWVEEAEHEVLRSQGVAIFSEQEGWPRARVECDYRLPFFVEEEAIVELTLMEAGRSSLTWSFRMLKDQGALAAEGQMVTVLVDQNGSKEISAEVRTKLKG